MGQGDGAEVVLELLVQLPAGNGRPALRRLAPSNDFSERTLIRWENTNLPHCF